MEAPDVSLGGDFRRFLCLLVQPLVQRVLGTTVTSGRFSDRTLSGYVRDVEAAGSNPVIPTSKKGTGRMSFSFTFLLDTGIKSDCQIGDHLRLTAVTDSLNAQKSDDPARARLKSPQINYRAEQYWRCRRALSQSHTARHGVTQRQSIVDDKC